MNCNKYRLKKWIVFLLYVVGLLLLGMSSPAFASDTSAEAVHGTPVEQRAAYDPESVIINGKYVTYTFESHLPVVIIETPLKENARSEQSASIRVVDEPGNAQEFDGRVQTVTVPAEKSLPKESYYIRLKEYAPEALSLAGMNQSTGWLLLSNAHDKSLMRNFLAYAVAGFLGESVPQMVFCEVLLREGGAYLYQGVYLLVCDDGVASRYYTSDIPAPEQQDTIAIRRTPDSGAALQLPTASAESQYPSGYLSLPYREGDISSALSTQITSDLNALETALYSDDPVLFGNFTKHIDIDSFVSYFILNDYFGNMGAGWSSLYTYDTSTRKIAPSFLIGFESSLDNDPATPLIAGEAFLSNAPWFERLTKSKIFLDALRQKYRAIREGALSDQSMDDLIGKVTLHLGAAQQRDWYRWKDMYEGEGAIAPDDTEQEDAAADLLPRIRQMTSYQNELIRIRFLLNTRGLSLYATISELSNPPASQNRSRLDIIAPSDNYRLNALGFLGFIGLFLLSIRYVTLRTRRW